MSKMCKWHKRSGLTECDWQDCKAANPHKDTVCPKNTNAKCEIIPKKPKMVRIKCFVSVYDGFPDWISETAFDTCNKPAILTMESKHLKGDK